MIETSDKYKQLVYSRGEYDKFMRQFLPYALIKIIDVSARDSCGYTSTSEAFFNVFASLIDDTWKKSLGWGTAEDFQFLLSSDQVIMPDRDADVIQGLPTGWITEAMSDAQGRFNPPQVLTCQYTGLVTTIGRTLCWDMAYDNYPVDFDLVYYRVGAEIARDEVRGNNTWQFTSTVDVKRYDQMILTVYSTSHPYRRIRLLEDIPGIYIEFSEGEVVSLTLAQEVDVYSNELVTSEIDLVVQNTVKLLDILNPSGWERYLQRHQPVDLYLDMVFPDESRESVHLGYWELSTWKANNSSLEAQFTVRDPIDKLTRNRFIKGIYPTAARSLYDLAVEVFQDAGVTHYIIDDSLKNVKTTARLPIGTHKEVLRVIAQAGRCVVVPTPDGGIWVRDISPLLRANTLINDGVFNVGSAWTRSNANLSETYIFTGLHSILLGSGTGYIQQSVAGISGHKYYGRFHVLPTTDLENVNGNAGLYVNNVLRSVQLRTANLTEYRWTAVSYQFVADSASLAVKFQSTFASAVVYVDGFMLIDLTAIYGAGKEPDQEWCDTNIRFITDDMLLPPFVDPPSTDDLDYRVLFNPPSITLSDPISSVQTKIYTNTEEAEESELYKAVRTIRGTETFNIEFDSPCKSCTIKAYTNGTTTEVAIKSKTVYAAAATLTIQANGDIQIVVMGKRVNSSTTSFIVSSDLDVALIEDAADHIIDNELVTSLDVAEDLTSYALYWDTKRNKYEFDWRQNPAQEVLDHVKVHDDFDNNNVIMITERNLEYNAGTLQGDSKGVY